MQNLQPSPWKTSVYNHFFPLEDGNFGGINLLSNATLKLNAGEWEEVQDVLSRLDEMHPFFEALEANRFILSRDFDEIEYLRKIFNRSKDSPVGFSLGIITSLQCNFRCPYCYQDHTNSKMSESVQDSVLAYLQRVLPGKSKFHLAWWGGEPLLQAEMIESFGQKLQNLSKALDIKYSSSIISNCYLLTPRNIEILSRAALKHLQVTLDGPEEIHDSQRYLINKKPTFRIILKGLRLLIERMPELGITVRVNVSNELDDDALISSLLDDLDGLKSNIAIHFTPVAPSRSFDGLCSAKLRSSELINALINKAQDRGFAITMGRKTPGTVYCGAIPVDNWLIHPKGYVTKCTARMDSAEGSLGKLNADGTIDLNQEAPLWLGFSPFDIAECRQCSVLPTCMGGCLKVPMHSDPVLDRCAIKTGLKGFLRDRITRANNSFVFSA